MKIECFEDIDILLNPSISSLSAGDSYSLDRIKRLMDELGNPQDELKVIHVAGTSGKTSTAYYIAEMLRLNGYKTGLSTSPHIDEMNERLQLDLVPLGEDKFCRELPNFLEIFSKLSIKPTYFELFIAFAYWYFAKIKVDYAVMETGLGGSLDATNVVSRTDKICVITDIGLDHTDILGKTLAEISKQKAGIIQQNNTVIINLQGSEITKVIEKSVISKSARLEVVKNIDQTVDLPLIQKRNWSLAKAVVEHIFSLDNKKSLRESELKSAAKLIIPGRIERHKIDGKEIILDGAHNQQKMQALLESLRPELDEKICVILAIGINKKQHLLEMTRLVSSIASEIILTSFDTEQDFKQKSLNPAYLAEYFPDIKVTKIFDLKQAIKAALKTNSNKILITGSLYLMGKARKIIKPYPQIRFENFENSSRENHQY